MLTVGSAPAESMVVPRPLRKSWGSPMLNCVNVRFGVFKATSDTLDIPAGEIASPLIIVKETGTSCASCALRSAVTITSSSAELEDCENPRLGIAAASADKRNLV